MDPSSMDPSLYDSIAILHHNNKESLRLYDSSLAFNSSYLSPAKFSGLISIPKPIFDAAVNNTGFIIVGILPIISVPVSTAVSIPLPMDDKVSCILS